MRITLRSTDEIVECPPLARMWVGAAEDGTPIIGFITLAAGEDASEELQLALETHVVSEAVVTIPGTAKCRGCGCTADRPCIVWAASETGVERRGCRWVDDSLLLGMRRRRDPGDPMSIAAATYRAGKRLWNAEDDAVLGARYPHEPTPTIAHELRRSVTAVYARAWLLGLTKSAEYLASPDGCRLRRGDNVGAATRFKPGHAPANKGLRRPGWAPGRMKETQFKPGVRHGVAVRLYRPIGTERLSKDGYLQRKTNDDRPLQRRWRAVHVLLWEATHGPVPKGHAIAFRNGDKRDIRLENLQCISRRELMARNTLHNLPKPLAETIQLLGALNRRIRRRTKPHEKQDRRPA